MRISNIQFQISNFKYQSRSKRSKSGFTLIELIVVIAIIGILASLLLANYLGVRQRARDAQRKSDLRQIQAALEVYRSDNTFYPLAGTGPGRGYPIGTGACGSQFNGPSGSPNYMQKFPCDPKSGIMYTYTPGPAGCNNTSSYCYTYTIYACLENINDRQRDFLQTPPLPEKCPTTTQTYSYTLSNP